MNRSQSSAVQRKILLLLMHEPLMSFNKLWNREGRSNKFAYHLKSLEKTSLVEKTSDGKYRLASEGMKKIAYLESEDGKTSKLPLMAVAVLISQGSKYLMLKREKEPFYGYWGIHGGKLRAENYILEQAKESVKKETGLSCDFELKGLFSSKTYSGKELMFNHQLFVVKAANPKGLLVEKTKKGVNMWVDKKEVKKLHILPNIPSLVKIAESKKFMCIEADRLEKNGKMKIRMR